VQIKEYEASLEGIIESFRARYPGLDEVRSPWHGSTTTTTTTTTTSLGTATAKAAVVSIIYHYHYSSRRCRKCETDHLWIDVMMSGYHDGRRWWPCGGRIKTAHGHSSPWRMRGSEPRTRDGRDAIIIIVPHLLSAPLIW